ncbi:MAG TPA: WcaI family glycosyltransferase, partial [Gemmatimonadales bacterium]|nr:WcaI family glycosyltransferase [Gemmatimonadales bacterium]
CRFFVEAGHQVAVVTTFPFYPDLPRESRYTGRWFLTERLDGMVVHRCFSYMPRRWNVRGRIAHEVSFTLGLVPRATTLRADVWVVVSPSFAPAVAATALARLRGIPVAVHLQDLQPDAAAHLGMIRNSLVLGGLYWAERWLYRQAALVSALDDAMRARIVAKGVPPDRVVVFPNWVDLDLAAPAGRGRAFRVEHGFGDQFLVVYSGSMGVKHGLELILNVAAVAVEDPGVRFVLIGDGAARDDLARAARERQLANVTFLPVQPVERFPGVIAASDVSLIPQRPEVRDLVLPSKVLRVLAGGSPIVAAAHPDSGLAHALRQAGAGLVVPRDDPRVVWEAIQQLKANPERRATMGDRGRAYAAAHFARPTVLGRYLRRLEALVAPSPAAAARDARRG